MIYPMFLFFIYALLPPISPQIGNRFYFNPHCYNEEVVEEVYPLFKS